MPMTLGFLEKIFYMPEGEDGGGAAVAESQESSEDTGATDDSGQSSSDSSHAPGLLADAGKESASRNGDSAQNGDSIDESTAGDETSGDVRHRPENVSEQFWDAQKGEVKVATLSNSYNELRKELNRVKQQKGGDALENAEAYLVDYKPPHRARATGGNKEGEVLDRYGDMDAGAPLLKALARFAKNGEMSKGQFDDGMQDFLEAMHPMIREPHNAEKEKAILGEGAEHMINTNSDWVNTLQQNGVLNEDEYNLLMSYGTTALGVQLVNKLRLNSGERPIPGNLGGSANTGAKTPEECQAMLADERYEAPGPAGDAYRAEVTKEFARTWGTDKS